MSDNATQPVQQAHHQAVRDAAGNEPVLNATAIFLILAPTAGYYLANAILPNPLVGSVAIFLLAGAGLFLLAFTGRPTRARMSWMVRYCYLFCFLSVVMAFLPFFLLDASIDGSTNGAHRVSEQTRATAPLQTTLNRFLAGNKAIGVIVGCRNTDARKPAQPYVDCETAGFQWVVHIGGTLRRVVSENSDPEANHYAQNAADTQPRLQHASYRLPATTPGTESATAYARMNSGILKDETQANLKRYHVEGGIIFPLYLIVISLIGGAVSLTRRVPVIQCHLWESMQDMAMDKRYQVRQDLILQMMQFVSAPCVAVIAFSILEPASVAMAVGGAFLSGFASEYVLLSISNLFDKLKPEAVSKSKY